METQVFVRRLRLRGPAELVLAQVVSQTDKTMKVRMPGQTAITTVPVSETKSVASVYRTRTVDPSHPTQIVGVALPGKNSLAALLGNR